MRSGAVIDLKIAQGEVRALVSGSDVYEVEVGVVPIPPQRWKAVCQDCSGAIDSLVDLLQGRFSKATMERLCRESAGMFPFPKEMKFSCSCPDSARMCKHVAAVLYGVGAKLDRQPELLFTLRNVDQQDLIAGAGGQVASQFANVRSARRLDSGNLSELFGIDIAQPKRAVRPKRSAQPKSLKKRRS